MKRRTFLLGLASGSALVLTSGGVWLSKQSHNRPLSLKGAIETLNSFALTDLADLETTGEWSLYQILIHCAQSVEYSMTGYPEHKSELFKNTVGPLAYSAFSLKGQMTHSLSEAIPGAERIKPSGDLHDAYQRLLTAMNAFSAFNGTLAAHFAYGELSKKEYEIAHAMHFYNHLDEIIIPSLTT